MGSGWTIFNNKGKPVRQYEPFFSQLAEKRHRFEFGVQAGVSAILFYDPVERVIATLHPNHTYEKVVFNPWLQTTYDVNDTVAANGRETGDPRTDADIKGHMAEYFETQSDTWQTWHQERITGANAQEKTAAEKSAKHANTPTTAHFDTLGRPFLTVAHNRFERNGAIKEEEYPTRVELDIEGNQRAVIDAEDRIVMRYDCDMLGNVVHQASMEAGERWMLNDVIGKAIRAWNSRRFIRRMTYDELRRPLGLFVSENGAPEFLAEKTEYGESKPHPEASNHRGKVWKVYDGAGLVTSVLYDFKGNLLEGRRDLLPGYKQAVNWLLNPAANDGSFTSSTTYDALNRPLTVTSPDGSVYRPTFNEANLLDKVDVNLRGEQESGQPKWTSFVTNINYNAKGQRELIAYANGAQTSYEYDPFTFRLIHLETTRPALLNSLAPIFADPTILQDLRYTYDPAGNITRIEDAALKIVFHNDQQVEPVCNYVYDAVYRLIEASGREHIGQTAHDFNPQNRRDYDFVGLAHFIAHSNDLQALRTYTERYEYDAVGNFDAVRHTANGGNWTRRYDYEEDSLIEPGKQSNRLTRTTVGNGFNHIETYSYTDAQGNDVHGCMTAINAMKMVWDFEDQLQQVDLGGGGTAYYVYDAAGQRVRKVIENQNGTRAEERLYIGGFEVYRKHTGANAGLVRETLHIMDGRQQIAVVEIRTQGNDDSLPQLIRYQFGNHLGSASLELGKDGALISYEEYHPYGTIAFQAGRSAAEVSLKRYRYTGMERDEETGLAYHRVRYYAPWLGRWTSADPAGLMGGVAVYEYSRNNPNRFIDLDGRQPQRYTEGQPEEDPWNRAVIVNALQEEVNQAQRGTRKYRYASERLDTFKETGWDPGPRVNIEGGPAPVNIAAHHAGSFIAPAAAAFGSLRFAIYLTAVSAGEAISGRSAGVLNPMRVLSGDADKLMIGSELGVAERVLSGVGAILGLGGAAWSKWSPRIQEPIPTPVSSPPTTNVTPAPAGAPAPPPTYTPNPRIQPHGQQPSPRPTDTQSHHPEQQAALSRNIANYNPDRDPALLMGTPSHRGTFAPQAAQRARGAGFAADLGTPQALGEAAVIMVRAGESAATAGQVVLEHIGYLFSTTPLGNVLRNLP